MGPNVSKLLAKRWLLTLAIVLLALALRVAHVYEFSASPLSDGWLLMDSRYYDAEARRICEGEADATEPYYMAPLYPHALAAVYSVVRDRDAAWPYHRGPHAALWLQCLVGALSAAVMAWIAFLLFGRCAGLLSGLVAAAYEPFIYHDGLLMPSSLILLLNLLTLLALVLAARHRTWPWWLLAGFLLGLASVAHGTALLLGPGIALWLLLAWRELPWRRRLAWSALVTVAACVPVGLVFARNLYVSGDPVLLTSNAGRNFFIGSGPGATGTFYLLPTLWKGSDLGAHLTGFAREPGDPAASDISRRYTREALKAIASDPLRYLRLEFRKLRLLLGANEVGINDQLYFARRYSRILSFPSPTFLVVAPLGLLGLGLGLRRFRELSPLYLVLFCQAVAFLLMFVLGRYRLTLAACLVIFAAGALAWLWERARAGSRRSLLVAVLCLALLFAFVAWPIPGIDPERGWGNQYLHVGRSYLARGDLQQAAVSFERAVGADFRPWEDVARRRAECYLYLGRLKERSGSRREALSSYRDGLRALRKAEGDDERVRRLERQLMQARERLGSVAIGP